MFFIHIKSHQSEKPALDSSVYVEYSFCILSFCIFILFFREKHFPEMLVNDTLKEIPGDTYFCYSRYRGVRLVPGHREEIFRAASQTM
jgi:hypothetical protein